MRYSSAVVLSTLAAGSAAASHLHNRHASFHARRQAEVKRNDGAHNVDWNAVAYSLKDVKWDELHYGDHHAPASSHAPSLPPPPVAAPEQQAAPKPKPNPAPAPEVKVEARVSSSSSAAPPAQTPAQLSPSPKPKPDDKEDDKNDSLGDMIGDFIDDLLDGVDAVASRLGAKIGKNDKQNNHGIWIGDGSEWNAVFTNDDSTDAVLYCWKANGFSGMSVNVNVPEISVSLKSGKSVTLSFAPNVPAACAPIYPDTELAIFGGIQNTWWEVTFGENGCHDVSRNVFMKGNRIHAKGSKCVSDMEICVYKCKDPNAPFCKEGHEYDLFNCTASNGGGGGYDVVMAGTGGGCAMGANGETVHVTISR